MEHSASGVFCFAVTGLDPNDSIIVASASGTTLTGPENDQPIAETGRPGVCRSDQFAVLTFHRQVTIGTAIAPTSASLYLQDEDFTFIVA